MKNQKWFKLLVAVMIVSILIIGATPALQRYNLIYVKKLVVTGSGGLVLGDASGSLDLNGKEMTLDADDDSSITCDTDDQCDWELGGADEYVLTAAIFDIGEGTLTRIDFDADNDTSIRSSADDQIDLELGGSDIYTMTASNFHFNGKVLDLDVDIDTSITASADDQIDIEIAGADEYILTAGILDIGNGTLSRIDLDADNDTSIRSSADDQLDLELGGSDQFVMKIPPAAITGSQTTRLFELAATTTVYTNGTNILSGLNIDLAIADATGGENTISAIEIDPITDDAQITEKAIKIGDEWDIAIDTNSPIVATAVAWMDDFLGDTVLAQYTEVSGSDAEAVQAIQEEQFGVYQLTSGDVGNTAADLEGVYLSLEWQADQGALIYETRLHLDAAITTVEICAGFTDDVTTVELPFTNASDTVTAVADDAVMFCFDTGSTTVEWFVNGAAAGIEATGIAAAGVAPAANVYQTLRIEIDDGGADCRFYIDGSLVGTLTANCVTNTDLLAPGVVISSGGAVASHVVDVDYIFAGAARD